MWRGRQGSEDARQPGSLYGNVIAALTAAAASAATERARGYYRDLLERTVRAGTLDHPARYTPARQRVGARSYLRRQVSVDTYACSQGVAEPLRWRGRRLLKGVWDLAIYGQLLQELRPRTIVELGAGPGASALWFADQAIGLGIDCHVVSLDRSPPPAVRGRPSVTYQYCDLEGDLAMLVAALRRRPAATPLLVVEDAHVAIPAVLSCVDAELDRGDYLVIEDSEGKQAELVAFLEKAQRDYYVDNMLCDRFGVNAASAMNSIFMVGPPER
ncbi:hypothetical protein JQS43_12485 [Natronosporangium hydrolyticum]|uniref:Rhamnosyl O-methyltransferase n=1 Tax=Natronosporangium hydrolyticum TaxID=2811111 RepID=A0A895YQI7_9ACTN|nr:CmcI family methyltransferase [Natronosporangium hydrolyticum]QSB17006.1 hypothetical protein JQS43_12485 [Natronosporangium hydrolyticum]